MDAHPSKAFHSILWMEFYFQLTRLSLLKYHSLGKVPANPSKILKLELAVSCKRWKL